MARTKNDAINTIDALHPIDSRFSSTNKIGEKILIEAIKKFNWRDLPDGILHMYSALCLEEERTGRIGDEIFTN